MGRDERRWLFVLGVLSVAWCVGACDGKQESPPLKDQGPSPHDVLQVDGSGEGGGPLPDLRGEAAPPPLTVTSTLPVDKATEVTLSSSISVTFSRAIDPATATASSLTLVPEGLTLPPGAMSTTVSASLATATLTSAYPLCPLTTYAATATTAFADLQKNALAADYRWRFTTTDGAWSAPHVGPAASTAVAGAIGARGDVVIVWFRGGHVYAQRYDAAKASWASAVQVDLAKDGLYGRPGVAVDARGDAIVAWIQGGMQDLYAARYDVATATWSAPKALEKVGELVTDGPSVAMSPSGDAMVVFIQETPGAGTTGTAVYYATHDGKAWSARSAMPTSGTLPDRAIRVVSDRLGGFVAAWYDRAGASTYALRANVFDATKRAWKVQSAQITASVEANAHVALAASPGGAALAWRTPSALASSHVTVARYVGGAWEAGVDVSKNSAGDVDDPDVAIARSGEVVVAWPEGGAAQGLKLARHTPAVGWSAPSVLSAEQGDALRIALDDGGHGYVVWSQDSTRLRGVRIRAGVAAAPSWLTPARHGWTAAATLAVNACGQGVLTATYDNSGTKDPVDALLFR